MHEFITVLALVGCAFAQEDRTPLRNPMAGDVRAIEAGRVMFRMYCASCHGLHATGGRSGPDLTRGTFAEGDTDADLYRVVSNGVPGAEMPAFGNRLDKDDLWQVISYVRSLTARPGPPASGDSTASRSSVARSRRYASIFSKLPRFSSFLMRCTNLVTSGFLIDTCAGSP